jgi:beta-glucosidase
VIVDASAVAKSKDMTPIQIMEISTNAVDSAGRAVEVSFSLVNVGDVAGSEIAQVYLSFPPEAREPVKQLKNFIKVDLQVGESKVVKTSLSLRDLSVWDADAHKWNIIRGQYGIAIGGSSADVKINTVFDL